MNLLKPCRRLVQHPNQAPEMRRQDRPNLGRILPSIEQEKLDQMFLALRLRREGLTFKAIGIRVPTTLINGHGRLKTPHPRGKESSRWLVLKAQHRESFFFARATFDSPARKAYDFASQLEKQKADPAIVKEAWLVAMDAELENSWWTVDVTSMMLSKTASSADRGDDLNA
jgi:hypothetical protein